MNIGKCFWKAVDVIGCPVVTPFFMGGWSAKGALKKGAELKKCGYKVTYSPLGEHVANMRDVFRAQGITIRLINMMDETNHGNVAIKATLFGLDIDKEFFYARARMVVLAAMEKGIEVEFDAEMRSTIPDTFEVFNRFARKFPYCNFVRQCVQAHLADIMELMDEYGLWDRRLRVVKGAGVYSEADGVVLEDVNRVMDQYWTIIERNYSQKGQVPYVATVRDESVALRAASIPPNPYIRPYRPVIEMLYGPLGRRLAKKLLKDGQDVRIYIPFVASPTDFSWFSYGLRRAAMMRRLVWEEIKAQLDKK